jgi:hypothetical protein
VKAPEECNVKDAKGTHASRRRWPPGLVAMPRRDRGDQYAKHPLPHRWADGRQGGARGSPCFVVCPFRARKRRHGLPERKRNGQDRSIAGMPRRVWANRPSKKCGHGRDNVSAVSSIEGWTRWRSAVSVAPQHRDARRGRCPRKKRAPARPGHNDSSGQDLNTSRRGRARPCPVSGEATGQDVRTATSIAGERRNTNPVRPGLECRPRVPWTHETARPRAATCVEMSFFSQSCAKPALPGLQPSSRHACGCAKSVNAGAITARDRA